MGNQGSQYSSLLVRLPLSLQDVPPVLVDANTGPATSLLHVTFQGVSSNVCKNQMLLMFTDVRHMSGTLQKMGSFLINWS